MPSEEQLANNFDCNMYGPSQNIKVGQKLPIMARRVSHLSFLLRKSGAPSGNVTFTIRKSSDKSLIAEKLWGNATALTTAATWYEVELDSPVDVNETAITMVEFSGGNAANYVRCREQSSDVKAGENDNRFGLVWENNTGVDCAYKYTYELTPTPPTVTIQAMTEMGRNTAKGHGNVTALGVPNPTAHGHCWNTTGSPTTADSKTDLGAKDATGAFESDLADLDSGVTHYVRAYATNDAGTSYSDEINFTTRTGVSQKYDYWTPGGIDQGSVYDVVWDAQVFVPSVEHPILKVRLQLWRTGNPGTFTVSIRAVSEGKPTGEDLCFGSIDGNALTTDTEGEWHDIEFDLGTIQDLLLVGHGYAIVLRAPSGSSPDNTVCYRALPIAYPRGYRSESGDSGENWSILPTVSIQFEEWGTTIGIPTVTTDPATSIEEETAIGNGNITDNGGEDCDKRGFVYDTSPHGDPGDTAPADSEYSNYVEETNSFASGAFTGALTSLEPNTTHYIRAYAHNSAGYSYGNEVSFTTLGAIPSVTTNPATALSAIAATLNGTLDSDGGEACECGFEWGLDTGYGTTTPPQSKTSGETFSQVIGGLYPGTTYHFRALATNSFGTGYGADRTFATALVISRAFALAREEL